MAAPGRCASRASTRRSRPGSSRSSWCSKDGDGREVWVVDGDRAERRAVTLGRRNALQVEVLAGLRAGEQVIVSSTASFGERRRVQLTD
ncbi:hypothetical protein ABXN37_10635 [Piscinibacter sakaiensis]|uniref:hypothetical protein n=1 Tax=Piscinibacter sakaiensis TaxID=1547922 RepID=UPI00372C063D